MGMRLSDCILRVFIYYNLPGLLHRNAGNGRFPLRAGSGWDRILPGRGLSAVCYRRWSVPFALLRLYKNNSCLLSLLNKIGLIGCMEAGKH